MEPSHPAGTRPKFVQTDREKIKRYILCEIKRITEVNGGVPPGVENFRQETGIKSSDWRGKIWPRWRDALREAGFRPNELQTAYDDDFLIGKFIELSRELGHFPVAEEIKIKARTDHNFPWHSTFARLGRKRELAAKILSYCKKHSDYKDIEILCSSFVEKANEQNEAEEFGVGSLENVSDATKEGYVYLALLKLGREKRYKIGKAVLVERRRDQISLQLPEDLELLHSISTDDAYGIENYWHRRFAAKNTKGEWFLLSRKDVEAFKRRKFM
jgi:hypothetical protein